MLVTLITDIQVCFVIMCYVCLINCMCLIMVCGIWDFY